MKSVSGRTIGRIGMAGCALLLPLGVHAAIAHGWLAVPLASVSALSYSGIYLALLLLFGRSLLPGHVPIVTALAVRMRGDLPAAVERYTRTVTAVWCVFFTAQLLVSSALLASAPLRVWSVFANLLDLPLVLLMFAVEYAVRRWRFRGERHHSPLAALRAFRQFRA